MQRVFVHDMQNLLSIIVGYTNLILGDMAADDPKRHDVEEIDKAAESALELLARWAAPPPGDEIS